MDWSTWPSFGVVVCSTVPYLPNYNTVELPLPTSWWQLCTNSSFSPIPPAWQILIAHKGFLVKCGLVIIFCLHCHMLSQNYCIQPHAVPELLYPCHRSISLISIPDSSWFTTGIRSSLWESRKLNSCNLCIHKLSDIQQLWHTLKLIHSQTTDTWLWWKLYCCEM